MLIRLAEVAGVFAESVKKAASAASRARRPRRASRGVAGAKRLRRRLAEDVDALREGADRGDSARVAEVSVDG
jgi:hypothetical protein